MQYISYYESPLGKILLTADEKALTGLWFETQNHIMSAVNNKYKEKNLPVFSDAKKWLDIYFSGQEPGFNLPLHFTGTAFQKEVWELLCSIPYGETTTYGEIANIIAEKRGVVKMSAQAVGGAVGRNKISIIIPCHRVIGADGSLIGYAGGLEKKAMLLQKERNKGL